MLCWWSPAQPRQMFYENSERKAAALNGRVFPQPAAPQSLEAACMAGNTANVGVREGAFVESLFPLSNAGHRSSCRPAHRAGADLAALGEIPERSDGKLRAGRGTFVLHQRTHLQFPVCDPPDPRRSGLGAIYWLDLGNNAASGQYVLGQPLNRANRRNADRLRTVSELYPEIVDAAAGEDDLPSCSAREALERQEPFINQTLAASALAMLSQLFRYGKLGHHGGFFNAQTGRMSALPIDPRMWAKARRRNRHVFSGGVHGIERSKLHP